MFQPIISRGDVASRFQTVSLLFIDSVYIVMGDFTKNNGHQKVTFKFLIQQNKMTEHEPPHQYGNR